MTKFHAATPVDLGRWIEQQQLQPPLLVRLLGDLGAGKTEWVRQFVRTQGGDANQVGSPTYSLHNLYQIVCGVRVHHLDLYRLQSPEELEGIGFWELFEEPAFVFVEWPQVFGNAPVPWPTLTIRLEKLQSGGVELQAAWGVDGC